MSDIQNLMQQILRESKPLPQITISEYQGFYLLNFPKDEEVVKLIKARIPSTFRSWRHDLNYGWLIHPDYIETMCQIFEECYPPGKIRRPRPISVNPQVEIKLFSIEYIGACRDRGDGRVTACGALSPDDWGVEFPENVLKVFFGGKIDLNPVDQQTLYQILLVKEACDFQSLKSAHRRLVRQWHPDLCKEPDAAERFRMIQEAYEILSDPMSRRKYDAGLFFERQNKTEDETDFKPFPDLYGYRAPLTSGLVTVKGIQGLARFVVSEILTWEDLKNTKDQIAISSWSPGAQTYQIIWR